MIERFDLCILGAGSGGLSVAAGAAQLGMKVALLEPGAMGGDCLNSGCVPSKALLAAGKAAHAGQAAATFGVSYDPPRVDFGAVKDHVAGVIETIAPVDSQERFEGLGCTVIRAAGKFVDRRTVEADGRRIRARRFVIATGSRAGVPPIPGLADGPYLTNETIFSLRERPEHLIIIGGGAIGCEMAQAHRRLGCAVTIVDLGPILPRDDADLVDIVRQTLMGEGIAIIERATIERVEHDAGTVRLVLGDGQTVEGSHLLVAAGRTPTVEGLGLEAAGVSYSKKGIAVDPRRRTTNKRIFAIGDCREGPQFTHSAGYEAGIVIQNALFRIPAKVHYAALPWVTFTDPELAQVGLTEAAAKAAHGDDVRILHWRFDENDRAQAEKRTEGMAKVVLVKGKVAGASIAGPNAGELIQTWTLAITAKLSLRQITGIIAPYPTYAEINKRLASSAYTASLFSDRTRTLVRFLRWFG
ncbi:NAD(P)/FAD-dependent oxidoreductase [Sphingomonas sp. 28-63-12]|uniref:dihydrolipoyl dehydrogenase family protein n=1 Tax=Sphingomonas sp. 28-63-12 TaxID=1970434 RepID=UPI000BDBFFB3|nr:MAG: dihydrolipoamide dehydrogenase [Sphingomonas sp. 28-63-12]